MVTLENMLYFLDYNILKRSKTRFLLIFIRRCTWVLQLWGKCTTILSKCIRWDHMIPTAWYTMIAPSLLVGICNVEEETARGVLCCHPQQWEHVYIWTRCELCWKRIFRLHIWHLWNGKKLFCKRNKFFVSSRNTVYKWVNWGEPEQAPHWSKRWYVCMSVTSSQMVNGQNTVPMVCTVVTCTEGQQVSCIQMVSNMKCGIASSVTCIDIANNVESNKARERRECNRLWRERRVYTACWQLSSV